MIWSEFSCMGKNGSLFELPAFQQTHNVARSSSHTMWITKTQHIGILCPKSSEKECTLEKLGDVKYSASYIYSRYNLLQTVSCKRFVKYDVFDSVVTRWYLHRCENNEYRYRLTYLYLRSGQSLLPPSYDF